MFKLIITVSGRPSMDGFTIREFKWDENHKAHIYEGREFAPEEFNAKYEKAVRNNGDLRPQARVIPAKSVEVSPVAPPQPVLSVTIAEPPPAAPRTITVDEAEAIMRQHAPHRLRGKPGPRAKVLEV